ncbi:Fur family transcriptional regulator [Chloroflexota bacterium]
MEKISSLRSLGGRRSTAQRRLLLDLIQQADGHLDADELYRRAREQESSISLSTVYRNLKLFKDLGLIEERHFGEEHHHYEARAATEHHHLVCLCCGEVLEFENQLTERLKHKVGKEKEFLVTNAEIHLTGYCARCQQEMSSE